MSFRLETAKIEEGKGMAECSTIETVHGSFWRDTPWSDYSQQKCSDGCGGIHRVDFHTNAFQVLASVLSLGVYVPQTVEWWCVVERRDDAGKKKAKRGGELEEEEEEEDETIEEEIEEEDDGRSSR